MAYPTTGIEGAVTSWGSANFYSQFLSNITANRARLTQSTDTLDSTGLGAASMANRPGLTTWDVEITAHAFSTPRVGNAGSVAFSSGGYALYVEEFEVEITCPPLDYTSLTSAPTARIFRPGLPTWRGSFRAKIDNTTAIVPANIIGDTLKTLTLIYGTDTSNNRLVGTAVLTPLEAEIQVGQINTIGYSFVGTGDLLASGTSSLFGTGTNPTTNYVMTPAWSQGGAAAGALVLTASTGRTYSLADSFWNSITLRCPVAGLVSCEIGAKALTSLTIG